jgi:adenosylhomocysteine nucleosidase
VRSPGSRAGSFRTCQGLEARIAAGPGIPSQTGLTTIGAGGDAPGRHDITAMLRSVMRRPRELPALLQTALDARAARATLLRGRQLLGASLGVPDFGEFKLDVA